MFLTLSRLLRDCYDSFVDIIIYDDDEVGANSYVLKKARGFDIPCLRIEELVEELTIDGDTPPATNAATGEQIRQLAYRNNLYGEDEGDELDLHDHDERRRLRDLGYCAQCIDHELNQEGAQPIWMNRGCPSCDPLRQRALW